MLTAIIVTATITSTAFAIITAWLLGRAYTLGWNDAIDDIEQKTLCTLRSYQQKNRPIDLKDHEDNN